ncbi:MAG: hypothetical protein ACRDA8_00220, partial [Shewanella sp.]
MKVRESDQGRFFFGTNSATLHLHNIGIGAVSGQSHNILTIWRRTLTNTVWELGMSNRCFR